MQTLRTLEKAIDILFHLRSSPEPQGVADIGRALGIPKSSTHRFLSSLGRRGLVERDPGGRYRPGFALVELGLGWLESEPLVVASRPILEEQARALGETFFLVSARGGHLVVLQKAEGTGFLRASPRVGARVPVHATATGKLYLAFAPELLAAEDGPLVQFTAQTLTDSHALEQSVALARSRSFASSREEWIPGLSVLAVPVRVDGRMLGALALAASTPRLAEIGVDDSLRHLQQAAEKLVRRLTGGSP